MTGLRFSRRHVCALASVLCLVCASPLFISCSPKTEVVENQAPALDISDLMTGQSLDMQQFKGKVRFVNFWATWCPPCKEEIPSIEALQRELGSDSRFAMITILYKDDSQNAVAYMKANGYTFPVYADRDGASAGHFKVTGVPETYLIDKKGALRKRVIGALDWNSPEARTYINTLLAE